MNRKLITAFVAASLVTAAAFAQHDSGEKKKPLSPPATASGTIGSAKVTVDYSAPSKRDRVIMGGLVPYDKVWRTGANAATTLTTSGDLEIGGLAVPAGKYTLYTIPAEKGWTLIINKQNGQWGTEYDEKQDLGRVGMTIWPVKSTVETFVISLKPGRNNKGTLTFTWENVEAIVPVSAK
jgi:Protein of unknown function (DUF2911)